MYVPVGTISQSSSTDISEEIWCQLKHQSSISQSSQSNDVNSISWASVGITGSRTQTNRVLVGGICSAVT